VAEEVDEEFAPFGARFESPQTLQGRHSER